MTINSGLRLLDVFGGQNMAPNFLQNIQGLNIANSDGKKGLSLDEFYKLGEQGILGSDVKNFMQANPNAAKAALKQKYELAYQRGYVVNGGVDPRIFGLHGGSNWQNQVGQADTKQAIANQDGKPGVSFAEFKALINHGHVDPNIVPPWLANASAQNPGQWEGFLKNIYSNLWNSHGHSSGTGLDVDAIT